MTQYSFLRVILGFLFVLCLLPAKAETDRHQITQTLTDYMEGTANGDPARLKKAFHPHFKLYAVTPSDELLIRSGAQYIADIKPGEKIDRVGRILSIDVEGNVATGKVEILMPKFRLYTDYFLLVKYQNQWKIVQKSYTWKEAPKHKDKILFVTSNKDTYGNTKINAANHFQEISIAYDVFTRNGYVVDFVSPDGGAIPLGYIETSDKTQKDYLYNAEFMNRLKHTLKPENISAADYKAVYYSGGGSAMFGVAENKAIQNLAGSIYESGGVVSAICHGTAGIVNLKNKDGSYIFVNRKITGFPDIFEDTKAEYYKAFPFSIDKEITKNGGNFVYSKAWASNFVVADGNIITGQDPSATAAVAQKVILTLQGKHANDLEAFDKIFSDVNSPHKPAVAVALLKNDQVIYQKSFGSTNLEYKTAATVDTKFQVDTLAWEFIAYATLMLEEQGKIRLDDDIRKYLPELPAFDHKITINHLLSSTDGIYGYKVLKSLAGWDAKEAGQPQATMQLIKRQRALNFRPGTEFSPGGNTRLILLANIVEAVSGQSFDVFCKTHIFDPLGMPNTLFVYDDQTLLENVAVPYRDAGKGVYRLDYGSAAGPVNLYSSIKDLATWRSRILSRAANLGSPEKKLGGAIKLDSGVVIKDISSISIYGQQHVGKERGIPKIYQLGSFGGYASSIFRFPEQEITVIVLSSGLAYNGSYGMRLAATLLKNDFLEAETIDYSKIKSVSLRPEQLKKFEGNYWNKERAIPAKAYVKNGVLHYSRLEGTERALIPLADTVFQMQIAGDDHYHIKFVGGNMHFSMSGSDPIIFEPHTLAHYTKAELAQFSGHFYSEELDSSFDLAEQNGILTASNLRTGQVSLKPVKPDVFYGNKSFMAGIQFIRGKNKEVLGFQVAVDEVRTLEFKKIRAVE